MSKLKRYTKEELLLDFNQIEKLAKMHNMIFTPEDGFALGYLAGKYNLYKLIGEKGWLIDAIKDYDRFDDLALYDTMGRIFIETRLLSITEF